MTLHLLEVILDGVRVEVNDRPNQLGARVFHSAEDTSDLRQEILDDQGFGSLIHAVKRCRVHTQQHMPTSYCQTKPLKHRQTSSSTRGRMSKTASDLGVVGLVCIHDLMPYYLMPYSYL